MNILVWAEMQSQDVLRTVDMMCPGIIEEKDVEYRYTNHQVAIPGIAELSPKGKAKIYAGLTLVGVGVWGVLDPSKAIQMRIIQKAFTKTGFFIGARFAGVGAGPGAAFGHHVGTTVGFLYLYVLPVLTIGKGLYMTAEGMIEYHQDSSGHFVQSFI